MPKKNSRNISLLWFFSQFVVKSADSGEKRIVTCVTLFRRLRREKQCARVRSLQK